MPSIAPITRRRLLASAGAGAAAVGLAGGGFLAGRQDAEAAGEGTGTVPFFGEHQAGIDTAAQDRLHFAAFDPLTEDPPELRELLREWTRAAAEMTTGETVGLLPSRLTVTFGFGPGLFEKPGLGLAGKRPAALKPLPPRGPTR